MTEPTLTLRGAGPADLGRVEAVLEANDLPSADVRQNPECFYVATAGSEFVGLGGVEADGSAGLLRSVVVTESHRGEGYGTALCEALEDRARGNGVRALYLLTATAAPFFRRRGYETVARADVPEAIRQTAEFSDLCPASATCMRKNLEG